MPAEWEKPMPLNTLLERGRTVAEYGRALAERVPYSLVALVSRFAVASVFSRSGRPRCTDFTRDRTPHDQRLQTLDEIEFSCRLFARPNCIVHGSIEHEAQEDDAGR